MTTSTRPPKSESPRNKGGRPTLDASAKRVQRTIGLAPDTDRLVQIVRFLYRERGLKITKGKKVTTSALIDKFVADAARAELARILGKEVGQAELARLIGVVRASKRKPSS